MVWTADLNVGLELYFKFDELDQDKNSPTFGMAKDFGDIKQDVKSVLNRLDHVFLNEILNPATAEVIAKHIHDKLRYDLGYTVTVVLWETDKYGVRYSA